MRTGIVVAVIVALASSSAPAQEGLSQVHLRVLLRNKIAHLKELAANPAMVSAVQAQNDKNVPLEKIKELDRKWASSDALTPFKKSLQEGVVGEYFTTMIGFQGAIYNEAFLTDQQGANVAAYPATTDYWQGDEHKWIRAFNNGVGSVYVGSIEFDESTQTKAVQMSAPVMANGRAIGVLIVGVTLTYVQAQYLEKAARAARERRGHD